MMRPPFLIQVEETIMSDKQSQIGSFIRKAKALNFVRRWNFYPTVRNESVAEHSFWVGFYVLMFILVKRGGKLEESDGNLVMAAMLHDIEEAVTGDMPTLVKRYTDGWHKVVEKAMDELTGGDPMLDGVTRLKKISSVGECEPVIKIADTLAAMAYAKEQSTVQPVFAKIHAEIAAQLRRTEGFPELQTLLDHMRVPSDKGRTYTASMTHLGEE
jgi:5'-deoxynucleotidase YfbR-like HD superfamily hydrolase